MTPALDRIRWIAALALSAGPLALAPHIATLSSSAHRTEPVGLTMADTREKAGVHAPPVVTSLMSGGMAAQAGIAVGDRVLAIDGRPVMTADMARADLNADLHHIASSPHACTMRIDLRRDGAPVVATLHSCA